jgi:hypothetical protein
MDAVENRPASKVAWMLAKKAPNEYAAPKISASRTCTAATTYQPWNNPLFFNMWCSCRGLTRTNVGIDTGYAWMSMGTSSQ